MPTVPINESPVEYYHNGWVITGSEQTLYVYQVVKEIYERQDAPCYQEVERTYLYAQLRPTDSGYRQALMALWNQIDAIKEIT